MELKIEKADLLRELEFVRGALQTKTTIPILANVALRAEDGKLFLAATDSEIAKTASVDAKVKSEGSATVPGKKLFDLLKLAPEGEVRIKLLENHWLEIFCGRTKYKLVGLSAENFPALPDFPDTLTRIPHALLADLIDKTGFAISKEESRYVLNGALLILSEHEISMVATDGHRLSLAKKALETGLVGTRKLLIPKDALEAFRSLGPGDTEFSDSDSHLFFRAGERRIAARKLQGQFPNYEAVLPKENGKSLILSAGGLRDAIRRIAQFADSRVPSVRMKFSGDGLELEATSADYGEAREVFSVKPEFALLIGFNSNYLLDFLGATKGDVLMQFSDEQSAGDFSPAGDTSYRYVVMPVRV